MSKTKEWNIEKISQIYHATDYLYESYISEFQNILKEIDEDFSEEELDGIIADVRNIWDVATNKIFIWLLQTFQIDIDGSGTIDFDEFCKIMT